MVLNFGLRIGITMDNNEKLDPEILKGMDEMTNIQNIVHNINLDMVAATEIVLECGKNINRLGYSGIDRQALIDASKMDGGKLGNLTHSLGTTTIGDKKIALNSDGVLTVEPDGREQTRPLVVNLFAGPGAGKSTGAALLFAFLKLQKVNVELVTEFAKELAWEGDKEFMANNQVYITGQQIRRMNRLIGKVDVIITDSPIELGSLYTEDETLQKLCLSEGGKWFRRLDFFVSRVKPYNPSGRNQTLDEARDIDQKIKNTVPGMLEITGDMEGYFRALNIILNVLGVDTSVSVPVNNDGSPQDFKFDLSSYADRMFYYYKQKDKKC